MYSKIWRPWHEQTETHSVRSQQEGRPLIHVTISAINIATGLRVSGAVRSTLDDLDRQRNGCLRHQQFTEDTTTSSLMTTETSDECHRVCYWSSSTACVWVCAHGKYWDKPTTFCQTVQQNAGDTHRLRSGNTLPYSPPIPHIKTVWSHTHTINHLQ